jgi:hypothetical protein
MEAINKLKKCMGPFSSMIAAWHTDLLFLNFIFAECQLVSLWSFPRLLFALLLVVLLGEDSHPFPTILLSALY